LPPVPLPLTARHRRFTPFPYTTLFRSKLPVRLRLPEVTNCCSAPTRRSADASNKTALLILRCPPAARFAAARRSRRSWQPRTARSEEHTSELQSPDHLVCRLLLAKKKT